MKKIFLSLALTFLAGMAIAAPPSVKAKLDSTSLLMGKVTTLRLEVVQDKGKPGGFPLLTSGGDKGYVGVCGDSVELRTQYSRDTTELGSGRIQINYAVPVQSFDSGMYRMPRFVYVSGTDTARSNELTLKVIPVKVGENDKIADYAPPADPEDSSIFDHLPDWIVSYWWLILLILAVGAAAWLGWKRYQSKGFILPRKPEPLPYDVAMEHLKKLKYQNLWEQGHEKEYFTRLTDILRVYLFKRFGINAIEMTTPEIVSKLNENPAIRDKRDYVKRILDTADFVKFAKVRPLAEDNIEAFNNALRFVEETKPTEEEVAAYKAEMEKAAEAELQARRLKRKEARSKRVSLFNFAAARKAARNASGADSAPKPKKRHRLGKPSSGKLKKKGGRR